MPPEPWDNPDLDDYEFLQGRMEGAGDWADSDATWFEAIASDGYPAAGVPHRSFPSFARPELGDPVGPVKRFRILEVFKGDEYVVSETGWSLRGHPFTFAPIVGRLDSQLLRRLTAEDASVDDPAHLLERAWFGQALGHRDRVVDLASRALRAVLQPPDKRAGGAIVALPWRREALAAAAMLSSALRELRDPERALHETEIFADDQYHPLMTSRAAALCDIGRWEEGKDLALSSQRIADSAQVRELLDRIRRHMAPPFSYAAG